MTLMDKASKQELRFQVVRVIAFTVERKKHTVIVKNPQDGKLYLFMKGADEAIYPLLARQNSEELA